MPIFQTPWDTTSQSGSIIAPTRQLLDNISLGSNVSELTIRPGDYEQDFNLLTITGGNSVVDVVKYFYHPLLLTKQSPTYGPKIAIDVRGFGKWDSASGSFYIRNMVEYKMMVMRACMNYFWLTRKPTVFRDMTALPIKLYTSMISETVKRTYSLDLGEQLRISVLAAYFYLGLFTASKEFSDAEKHKVISQIIAATSAPVQLIEELIEDLPIIDDILAFCEVCKQRVGSIRLDDFSYGILLTAIGGVWYATNSQEIMPIALEHPPTWLMIVYSCVSEATFKRSALAQMAERQGRSGVAQAFTNSMNSLFGGEKALKEIFEKA
jgi:hypothetical protein